MTDETLSVTVRIAPVLVGVEDAGRMLGVSAKTIRRMIAAGELPSVMVGLGGWAGSRAGHAEYRRSAHYRHLRW